RLDGLPVRYGLVDLRAIEKALARRAGQRTDRNEQCDYTQHAIISGPFHREREQKPRANELELPAIDDGLGPGQELVRQEHAPVVGEEHLVVELVESAKANPGPEVVGRAEGANGRIENGTTHDPLPSPERVPGDGQAPPDHLGDRDTALEDREVLVPVLEELRQGDRGPFVVAAALP